MTSHLVKMYRPFMKDLAKYFFIAIQMVQQIFAGAFYILSSTPTILQEVFINTPAYLINIIYTGISLIIDSALNAMEQCIVHFPIYVAKEVYKELPEEMLCRLYRFKSVDGTSVLFCDHLLHSTLCNMLVNFLSSVYYLFRDCIHFKKFDVSKFLLFFLSHYPKLILPYFTGRRFLDVAQKNSIQIGLS